MPTLLELIVTFSSAVCVGIWLAIIGARLPDGRIRSWMPAFAVLLFGDSVFPANRPQRRLHLLLLSAALMVITVGLGWFFFSNFDEQNLLFLFRLNTLGDIYSWGRSWSLVLWCPFSIYVGSLATLSAAIPLRGIQFSRAVQLKLKLSALVVAALIIGVGLCRVYASTADIGTRSAL